MTNIRLVHTIHTDVAGFWKLFFDSALNEALYRKALKFPKLEVLSFEETDAKITRKMAATPNLGALPGPVAKLLGGNFGYVEEGTFTKAEGVWRFKMIPTTLADKIKQEGTVRVEAQGDKAVKRTVEVNVEAKVFAIGGMVESAAEKTIREAWETSTTYMNEWIEGKHRDMV